MEPSSNRIVVGVDCSQGSVHALRWALREAVGTGAEVEAILVWSDPWVIVGPPSLFGAGKEGMARLQATLADRVKHAVDEEHAGDVRVIHRILPGHAPEALVNEAKDARLLVVGTTGLTGLRRWMLGSVSQRCAQLSHIPVVIVPADGEHGEHHDHGEHHEHTHPGQVANGT